MKNDSQLSVKNSELSSSSQDELMGHQLTEQYSRAVGGVVEVVKFGAMMLTMENHVTVSARGNGGKFGNKGDGMKGWLARFAPEVNLSTAYRFKDIAEGIRDNFKLGKKVDMHLLLTAPDEEMGDALRKKKIAILDFVQGKSQRQLLLALDKAPAKPRGGKREKTTDGDIPAEDSPEQAALDICKPIMQDVYLQWIDKTIYERLPEVGEISQRALVELSNQLHAKLAPLRKKFSR